MDNQHVIHKIRELFEETCVEQFESLSFNLKCLGDVNFDTARVPTATIDAGSFDFEIIIALHLPFSALAMTYPVQGEIMSVDESELEDWICELSNRLLGKMKARLHVWGHDLDTGLPDFTYKYEAYESMVEGHETFKYDFTVDSEVFEASIAIELLSDDIDFKEIEEDDDSFGDGELEFF